MERKLEVVEALYAFDATSENGLSFVAGDCMEVLQRDPSGWTKGKLKDKPGTGWFPSSYVKAVEDAKDTFADTESLDDDLPPGWRRMHDQASGRSYFVNENTNETRWDKPAAQAQAPQPQQQQEEEEEEEENAYGIVAPSSAIQVNIPPPPAPSTAPQPPQLPQAAKPSTQGRAPPPAPPISARPPLVPSANTPAILADDVYGDLPEHDQQQQQPQQHHQPQAQPQHHQPQAQPQHHQSQQQQPGFDDSIYGDAVAAAPQVAPRQPTQRPPMRPPSQHGQPMHPPQQQHQHHPGAPPLTPMQAPPPPQQSAMPPAQHHHQQQQQQQAQPLQPSFAADGSSSSNMRDPSKFHFRENFWQDAADGKPGFDLLVLKHRNGKEVCKDLAEFMRLRAAVEDQYAKALAKLAKVTLGDMEEGHMRQIWLSVKNDIAEEARERATFAIQLGTELDKDFMSFKDQQKMTRKSFEKTIAETRKDLASSVPGLEKSHANYIDKCVDYGRACEAYSQAQAVGASHKEQQKLADSRAKQEKKVNKAAEDYNKHVGKFNTRQKAWADGMVEACNTFEDAERDRHRFVGATVGRYCQSILDMNAAQSSRLQGCVDQYRRLSSDDEIQRFTSEHSTGQDYPQPVQVPGPDAVYTRFKQQQQQQQQQQMQQMQGNQPSASFA